VLFKDTIEVHATCRQVFAWLTAIKDEKTYKAWHPDHVHAEWVKGDPFEEGSVIYFEENIHGKLHKTHFLLKKIVADRLVLYQPLFPWSLFMPESSFRIDPLGKDRCWFTATIHLRAGPLFRWLGRRQIEAVRRHMKEEGENLKRAVEGGWSS